MKTKISLHQIRIVVLATAIALLIGGFGFWLGAHRVSLNLRQTPTVSIEKTQPADKQDIDFALFWDVWDKLSNTYLDKEVLLPEKMVYGAIKGMVASLGDPYTVFLEPEENKQAREDLNGSFEGVGIQLGYKDGQLAVIAPLAGMPAEKAGVKAGDLILKIEDRDTEGISLPEAVRLIRGPEGTKIKLTLLHEREEKPYEVTIVRETIIVPSVEVEFIEERCEGEDEPCLITHLKLMRFGDRTNEEWNEAVDEILKYPSIEGVILDLRNNPGGYLDGSVFIASEFLSSGVVVQQGNADGTKDVYSVNRNGEILDQPLVILVNRGSASASEIVAGALQEAQRARVVGEATFGKGTIQEAQELSGGAGLHITTARWLLPNGKSIDKEGIMPDYEVADNPETEVDEQLEKGIEILLNF